MGRLAEVFTLPGLWPFLKSMGLGHRQALGYGTARPLFLCALGQGWVAGLAILLVLALALLALGVWYRPVSAAAGLGAPPKRSFLPWLAACSSVFWRRPFSVAPSMPRSAVGAESPPPSSGRRSSTPYSTS